MASWVRPIYPGRYQERSKLVVYDYFSSMTCANASCRCTVNPAVPGGGGLLCTECLVACMMCFAPSTRMAQLLQPQGKSFPRQGTGPAWGTGTVTGDLARGLVRVLVICADGILWAGLGACWRKHLKSNRISKKWRSSLENKKRV